MSFTQNCSLSNRGEKMVEILVKPPELRQAASQLRESANKIGRALQGIDADLQALIGANFKGNRADELQSLYQSKREALQKTKEIVIQFATELEVAANIFEQADGYKSKVIQGSVNSQLPSSPFGASFADAYMNFYYVDKNFLDIMKTFMEGRGDFKNTLKLLGMGGAYDFFKNGIPYRGTLDSAFRDIGAGGIFGAVVVVGTLEDIIKGTYENEWKALGVNTVDGLLNLGLSYNPYVGAALLVNGGIQIGGNALLGLERVTGDFIAADDVTRAFLLEQSDLKAESLEKMDLGNITKSFSESICDGFLFTNEGRDGLVNTAKSTVNVLDGAVEFVDNTIVSQSSMAVAFTDRVIQSTDFLSDDIKKASADLAHNWLGGVTDYMDEINNVFEWK